MLVDDLINADFDRATATTLAQMAESQPLNEAAIFLSEVLGSDSDIITKYVNSRKKLDVQTLNAKNARIQVKMQKQKRAQYKSKFTSAQKSEAVKDLDQALKQLSVNDKSRVECECIGLKHGLLEQAPNCLNCGRIICKREGLGPCLTCGYPLLTSSHLQQLRSTLEDQKNAVLATMSKKALAAAGIDPNSRQDLTKLFKSNEEAEKHLEKTLNFQEHDAERTRIIDQVGEVDVVTEGVNQWSTPEEQARQLLEQQRQLRIMQAKELRHRGLGPKVLSIDIKGNRIMQKVEDAPIPEEFEDLEEQGPEVSLEDTQSYSYYDASRNKVNRDEMDMGKDTLISNRDTLTESNDPNGPNDPKKSNGSKETKELKEPKGPIDISSLSHNDAQIIRDENELLIY